MKHLTTFALCLALASPAAHAQQSEGDVGEGLDLLSEGTRLLLRGLMGEIEPALRELEGALMDMHAYHPPEVLPNGDIIIRRRVPKDVTPEDLPEVGEDGEVEL